MIVVRWAVSMGIAAGVTLGLFFFMSVLIATGETLSERLSVVKIVDATMPDIELEVIEEIDKPEPIEELTEEQPELQDKQINLDSGPSLNSSSSSFAATRSGSSSGSSGVINS